MQNRLKDEIIRDILKVANGGATMSQVMFKAYVSHSQAKGYLASLIERQFISYDQLDRTYRTTSPGIDYLKAAEQISDILSIKTKRSAIGTERAIAGF
jgi:predicted transcriptional regulator